MLYAALLAAALQEAPVPREAHVFHDWVVACDNGRRCQAVALQPEGREFQANGVMMIEREPEAEATLAIRIVQVESAPARLVVHGQALPVRLGEAEGDILVEPENRAALLELILYADQIDMQDAAGAVTGQLSLAGLRHALLYMDEAQGRLHTQGALIRTGRRPASDVPPAPPVPEVRIAPAATEAPLAIPPARIVQLRRESGCTIGDVGGPDDVSTAALGQRRTLVLLACGSGAYNVSIVPFVAVRDGRGIRIEAAPFDLPVEQWEEEEGHRILINGEWDSERRSIADFSRGRGFGDCGSRSTYGWDGALFRLLSREEMPECRGSNVFVTTWRADVTR
jgi:Protein of unknown function (DUF1176)